MRLRRSYGLCSRRNAGNQRDDNQALATTAENSQYSGMMFGAFNCGYCASALSNVVFRRIDNVAKVVVATNKWHLFANITLPSTGRVGESRSALLLHEQQVHAATTSALCQPGTSSCRCAHLILTVGLRPRQSSTPRSAAIAAAIRQFIAPVLMPIYTGWAKLLFNTRHIIFRAAHEAFRHHQQRLPDRNLSTQSTSAGKRRR